MIPGGNGNNNEIMPDVEELRDQMARWFVNEGALPGQEEAALRTSVQLRPTVL